MSCNCIKSLKTAPSLWPWILLNIALYAFILPWMAGAIVQRYWIEKDYDATLPGLDDTAARKFFMASHIGFGAICLILFPVQLTPVVRRRWPKFHRWTGMVSVTAALLTSVCGIVFIFLKKFRLVGGVNMGIAFFTAGLVLGVCAVMTVVHAKKRDIRRHMNWAIRTYSQILASPLYRYFYFVIGGLGGLERAAEESMKCDENDVCDYFLRTFDAIHAWTYFIFPLLFAELVVFALARQYKRQQQVEGASVEKTTATRSVEFSENVESGCGNDSMENEKCIEKKILKEQSGVANEAALSMDYLNLNVIGLVGAICCVGMTIFIYVTSALGVNAMSSV